MWTKLPKTFYLIFVFIFVSLSSFSQDRDNFENKFFVPKKNNLETISTKKIGNENEWKTLNKESFFNHPEFRTIPFNGPKGNWVELFEKRTATDRYFVNPNQPSEFSIQKSLGNIHYFKNNYWQTIDPHLQKIDENLFEASNQAEPVGFDLNSNFAYIKTLGGKIEFNRWKLYGQKDNLEVELAIANWSNFTVGDDGVSIKNIFPGIDAEMICKEGSIKTSFILKTLNFNDYENLIFEDAFSGNSENVKLKFKDSDISGNSAIGDLLLVANGKDVLEINEAVAYPLNSADESLIFSPYTITKNRLKLTISIEWIKQYIYTDHIVIDPPVSTTGTLAQAAITGSQYNASCNFDNSCDHSLSVTPPVSATLTSVVSNFDYVALGACTRNRGAITFSLNSCESPGPGLIWTCNVASQGTCTGTNTPLTPDFTPCLPSPSCNPVPLNFKLHFYRTCYGTSGCNSTCIRAGSAWVVTINGNTLNVGSASATGGTSTICQGQSANLFASGQNGTPPYSYLWNPVAITGQSISVSPTSTTVYSVLIKDACNNTVTQNVTVNVTPNSNPNFQISPQPACVGQAITFTGLGAGAANSYDWLLPSSSSAAVTNQQNVTGITYATPGTYNATLNYQQGLCTFPIVNQIVINDIPATPIINSNSPICSGQQLNLDGPTITGAIYNWTGPNLNSTLEDPSISNVVSTDAGQYNLSVTVNNCTSSPGIYNVIVNSIPNQPSITPSGPITFCPGGSVVLTCSLANSYLWSNGQTTQSITVSTAGTFSVQTTNAQGCTSIASLPITITINSAPSQPVITPSGPTTFCNGNSVTLTSSLGNSYLWSNGQTTQSITVSTAGTFSVQTSNAQGCTSISSSIISTVVNPGPGVPAISGGPLSFCQGGNVQLTGPAGFTYLWSNGSTSQSVTLSSTQTVTLAITDANGCTVTSAPTNVVSNSNPATPIITASGPLSICNGNSVTLSAPSGFTYLWNNGATTQNITVNSSGSFNVVVINANNCSSSNSLNSSVNVISTPAAPIINSTGGINSACAGQSITLNATGGLNYLWNTGQNGNSITVNTTGAYTVTSTDANGCTSLPSAPFNVSISSIPTIPIISISGSTTICSGQTLTISAPSANSYLWSNGSTSQTITVGASGNFSVVTIDANGCQSPSSAIVTVTVNPLPIVSISANSPTDFCIGGSTLLSPNTSFNSYLWSNGSTTQNININTSGIYSLQVTDNNGCTSLASNIININVYNLPLAPSINASSTTICQGNPVTLTCTTGTSYLWNTGETTSTIITSTPGNYSVSITDANGCTSALSSVLVLTSSPLPPTPVINTIGNLSFCDGGSVQLIGPAGYSGYIWTPSFPNNQTITVTTSGSYSLQVTDANGCNSLASAGILVDVFPLPPQPTILASGPISFCDGGNVQLSVDLLNVTYLWSDGQTTQQINVNSSGNYSVQVTSLQGCISPISTITNVTEFPIPATPSIIAMGSTSICQGSVCNLSCSAGINFLWFPNGETTQTISASTSGNFSVSIIDNNGCESPVSAPTAVTVLPLPPAPTISSSGPTTFCFGNSVTLSSDNLINNIWNTGATSQNIVVSTSGTYFVKVMGTNGCISLPSNNIDVNVISSPPPPYLSADGPLTFCEGEKVTLTVNNGQSALWNNGSIFLSQEFFETEMVTVNVVDNCGVSHNLQAQINKIQKPFVFFESIDSIGCIPLKILFNNQSSNFNFLAWDFGDGVTSTEYNPIHNYQTNGDFTVSLNAISPQGCFNSYSKTNYIKALEKPKADFKSKPIDEVKISKPEVEFFDFSTGEVTNWLWTFGQGDSSFIQNPMFSFKDTGSYNVKLWIKNKNECEDTISKNFRVLGDLIFYIPNTFSPNNDGVNDVFLPKGTYIDSKSFSMKIFNRWGEQIYFTQDISQGWNGENGIDKNKPSQTFYWQIEIKDNSGEAYNLNGTVTLIY